MSRIAPKKLHFGPTAADVVILCPKCKASVVRLDMMGDVTAEAIEIYRRFILEAHDEMYHAES